MIFLHVEIQRIKKICHIKLHESGIIYYHNIQILHEEHKAHFQIKQQKKTNTHITFLVCRNKITMKFNIIYLHNYSIWLLILSIYQLNPIKLKAWW